MAKWTDEQIAAAEKSHAEYMMGVRAEVKALGYTQADHDKIEAARKLAEAAAEKDAGGDAIAVEGLSVDT